MKYRTDKSIEGFSFHDSSIEEIRRDANLIILKLKSACICRGHPANDQVFAQTVEPCEVRLNKIREETAQIYNDTGKNFELHPEPHRPVVGDIAEFESTQDGEALRIKITGFANDYRWVEWHILCQSIEVVWN